MAVAFVGAGSGVATTTGSGTISKTGCTAGNVTLVHIASRGVTNDYSISNVVNMEALDAVPGTVDTVVSNSGISPGILHSVNIARVTANGTVSIDQNVGASGEDLFGRIYEFSGVHSGGSPGVGTVFENGANALGRDVNASNGTSVSFAFAGVTTNGNDRLAIIMGALASNQAVTDFTGETGGVDITEITPEFGSGTGATCTLWIQGGQAPTATTIDNGSFNVGVATDWVLVTFALIAAPTVAPGPGDDPPIGFSGRGAGW